MSADTDELRPSRSAHMAWCKQRALEYVERGDLWGGVESMLSDLRKEPSTAIEPLAAGLLALTIHGRVTAGDTAAVRHWIEGFA